MDLRFVQLAQGYEYEGSLNWLGTSLIIASVVLAAGGVVCAWLLSRNKG